MLRLGARESGRHSSAASRGALRGRWQGLPRPVGTEYPRSSTSGKACQHPGLCITVLLHAILMMIPREVPQVLALQAKIQRDGRFNEGRVPSGGRRTP